MSQFDPRYRRRFMATALRRPGDPGLAPANRQTIGPKGWRDVAFGLSLAAAVLSIAFSIWPIAYLPPHAREFAFLWGLVGHAAAALYLTAAYFGRRGRSVASPTLSVGGLVLIISGLSSGRLLALSALDFWWLAIAVDLLPIAAGIFAAGALRASTLAALALSEGIRVELPEGTELR